MPTIMNTQTSENRKFEAISNDMKAKKLMEKYYNRKCKEKEYNINDSVLVKKQSMNKSEPAYIPKPMKIVSKKGTMITAHDGKRQ